MESLRFPLCRMPQDTLHEPPSSVRTMRKAVAASLCTTFSAYLGVGLAGYAALGDATPGNILTGFRHPAGLVTAANAMVLVHMVGVRGGEGGGEGGRGGAAQGVLHAGRAACAWPHPTQGDPGCLALGRRPPHLLPLPSPTVCGCAAAQVPAYQVFSQPVFHMVEEALGPRLPALRRDDGRGLALRVALRSLYVAGTTLVACAMPFFSGDQGEGGGVLEGDPTAGETHRGRRAPVAGPIQRWPAAASPGCSTRPGSGIWQAATPLAAPATHDRPQTSSG